MEKVRFQRVPVVRAAQRALADKKSASYSLLSCGWSCRCMTMEKPNRLSGSPFIRATLSRSRLKADSRPHPSRKTTSSGSPQVVRAPMAQTQVVKC